jgi:hypothetical protein
MKLIEKLDAYFDESPDAIAEFFGDWVEPPTKDDLEDRGVTFKQVDSYGGEGMGDDYWLVYKFTDITTKETVSIKFDGYYASYVGSSYHDRFEVVPKEVTVTKWEKK